MANLTWYSTEKADRTFATKVELEQLRKATEGRTPDVSALATKEEVKGMWSLSLRDSEGKRLYMATFALVDGKLLAASIQGPAGEEAKDLVRSLTKQLHGLRPQQLMVTALQYFSASLNLDGIIGIAQEHQVKLRWRLKKRVKMNYDLFWQENGATLGDDGYWHLPQIPPRKDLAEIESKKRSMYRKRYQMLDNMAAEMQACFQKLDSAFSDDLCHLKNKQAF